MKTTIEHMLYGLPAGETERYMEVLLSTNQAAFERVRELASKDGFHSFREDSIDLRKRPDFRRTLAR